MKVLSLIISLSVFMASGYFFVTDFNLSDEMNHIIYMILLGILMLICVVGVLINLPLIIRERRKMKVLVYKNITRSQRRSKDRRLELHFETS